MKLLNILQEVIKELNVPRPEDAYKFDKILDKDLGYGKLYTYVYTNQNGDPMEISNMVTKHPKDPGKSIYIAFKKYEPKDPDEEEYDNSEEEERKYSEKTGAQDFIKVLATVVQATKNVMKKEGGEENIYSIKFSPSDKKRANVYMHYIGTLFPNFKEGPKEGMFTTFINKNFKEKEVVKEVGEATATPYPYTKTARSFEYASFYDFKSESGTEYEITILKGDENYSSPKDRNKIDYEVSFGVLRDDPVTDNAPYRFADFDVEVNKGEMYKVMATVVDCIKKEIELDKEEGKKVGKIFMTPAKRKGVKKDRARTNLYQAYVTKNMPAGSTVKVLANGNIRVQLPSK